MDAANLIKTLEGQLEDLETGKSTPAQANAVAHVVSTIMVVVKAQLQYHRQRGTRPEIPQLDTPRK